MALIYMKALQEKIGELVNFANTNISVHREIKQMASELKRTYMQAAKEIAQIQKSSRESRVALIKLQTEKKKVTKSGCCQTEEDDKEKKLDVRPHEIQNYRLRGN